MTQKYEQWQVVLRRLKERRISAARRGDERELDHIDGQLNEFYDDPEAYMRGYNKHVSLMEEAAHEY